MLEKYNQFRINRKKYKGFTLIELLSIIIILGLIISIVIFIFKDVFHSVNDTISKTDKNIILNAAKSYAQEYRGTDTWIEEIDDDGNVNFCVSMNSLINYGYFKNDGSNFEKYKDYVVGFKIENGVYKLVSQDKYYNGNPIDDSGICNRINFASKIKNNSVIKTEIKNKDNTETTGSFEYNVKKISDKIYSIDYNLDLKLTELIKDIYVTFVLDRSSSMGEGYGSGEKYINAKKAAINLSNNIVNNDNMSGKISLITFDRFSKVNREFSNSILKDSDFPEVGSGTGLVGGLDMAISLMCSNGLDVNSDNSKWCSDIASEKKENFKSYVIVLFDGSNAYVPAFEHNGVLYDGDYIKDSTYYRKNTYYKEFRNYSENGLITTKFIHSAADLQDFKFKEEFYDYYLKNSLKYLREQMETNLFLIGYEFIGLYINDPRDVRKLSSSGNKLCNGGLLLDGVKYCYYSASESSLENVLTTISNNIVNDSDISLIKFSFKPKEKNGETLINFLNSEGEVLDNNVFEKEYSGLTDLETDLKDSMSGIRFMFNDSLYKNYCESKNSCELNSQQLFDVEISIKYNDDSAQTYKINAPKFNIVLTKLKTIN